MKTKELTEQTGIDRETLRFYEKEGLFEVGDRTETGHRIYTKAHVEAINFIVQAKEAGFTLKEIKELLQMKNSKISCPEVREFAQSKMNVLEEKMMSLEKQHTVLREFVSTCDVNAAMGLNVCHMSFSSKRES